MPRLWHRPASPRVGNIDDYIILPERISREPLAPAYRQGDDEWGNVVDWAIHALVQAEESGITQSNVDEQAKSDNPGIKRLLGATPGMGKGLNTVTQPVQTPP